jgi:predicted outer membrane repeat protein
MFRRIAAALASLSALAAVALTATAAFAMTINVNCATTSLQTKINGAPAGSTLVVSGTCHGPIAIHKNLTLKGHPGATLDGDQLGSTVTISGATLVHLTSLTVTGGYATAGGGIQQQLGRLVLLHVTVTGNQAGGDSSVRGGGVYSTGTLSLVDSSVVDNAVFAGDSVKTSVGGGGIYTVGPLAITRSTVSGNTATATSSGDNASAAAAGVASTGPLVQITSSHVDGNRATSSADQQSSAEAGGMFVLAPSGHVAITGSTFDGTVATAHSTNGAVAEGGALFLAGARTTISNSRAESNRCHTVGGTTGAALGGGIVIDAHATLSHDHIDGNSISVSAATTAVGGAAGIGVGGGPLVISSSTVSRDTAVVHAGSGLIGEGGGLEADKGPITIGCPSRRAARRPSSAERWRWTACLR